MDTTRWRRLTPPPRRSHLERRAAIMLRIRYGNWDSSSFCFWFRSSFQFVTVWLWWLTWCLCWKWLVRDSCLSIWFSSSFCCGNGVTFFFFLSFLSRCDRLEIWWCHFLIMSFLSPALIGMSFDVVWFFFFGVKRWLRYSTLSSPFFFLIWFGFMDFRSYSRGFRNFWNRLFWLKVIFGVYFSNQRKRASIRD